MPGLLTAAAVTSLLGVLVCGSLIAQIAQKRDYLLLLFLVLLALPLSLGTYFFVRLPIKGAVDAKLAKIRRSIRRRGFATPH